MERTHLREFTNKEPTETIIPLNKMQVDYYFHKKLAGCNSMLLGINR